MELFILFILEVGEIRLGRVGGLEIFWGAEIYNQVCFCDGIFWGMEV